MAILASGAHAASSQDILERSLMCNDITDFANLKLAPTAKKWVERLGQDEFGTTKPFSHLKNYYAFAEILAKGVQSYSRTTFRSSRFIWQSGYDVLKYEVTHLDRSKTFILAFRLQTAMGQTRIGAPDQRTIKIMVYSKTQDNQLRVISYADGEMKSLQQASDSDIKNELEEVFASATPMTLSSL